MGSEPAVPYWHVNVPEADRTAECPEFLSDPSVKDREILSTPDQEYHIQTWDEVLQVVKSNRLEELQRIPSELRRYKEHTWKLAQEHGSVSNFVLRHRLRWGTPIRARGRPFEFPEDLKILYNDWPYGIDPRIVHLVVWTKFSLADDTPTDDLSEQRRREIDHFVAKTFCSRVPENQVSPRVKFHSFILAFEKLTWLGEKKVLWFRNFMSLKSIHGVEHFHVMLFDPDPEFVKFITNGDYPHSRMPGKCLPHDPVSRSRPDGL